MGIMLVVMSVFIMMVAALNVLVGVFGQFFDQNEAEALLMVLRMRLRQCSRYLLEQGGIFGCRRKCCKIGDIGDSKTSQAREGMWCCWDSYGNLVCDLPSLGCAINLASLLLACVCLVLALLLLLEWQSIFFLYPILGASSFLFMAAWYNLSFSVIWSDYFNDDLVFNDMEDDSEELQLAEFSQVWRERHSNDQGDEDSETWPFQDFDDEDLPADLAPRCLWMCARQDFDDFYGDEAGESSLAAEVQDLRAKFRKLNDLMAEFKGK